MMMARITNKTSMSLVIEDIGVRLQPAGFASVRADVASKSKDLKKYLKWISIDYFEIVSPVPAPCNVTPPPVPVPCNVTPPSRTEHMEMAKMRASIEQMKGMQEELFCLMKSMVGRANFGIKLDPQGMGEEPNPVLLIGDLIPKVTEANVKTSELELPAGDEFDSTLAALKKVKKSKV